MAVYSLRKFSAANRQGGKFNLFKHGKRDPSKAQNFNKENVEHFMTTGKGRAPQGKDKVEDVMELGSEITCSIAKVKHYMKPFQRINLQLQYILCKKFGEEKDIYY
jgi:hypothetical protein